MGSRDKRIDAYIAKSADFAKPILTHIRELVHAACPEVVETIKWGAPHFDYHGMMCGMASFKAHCAFGFWKSSLIVDTGDAKAKAAMGQFGTIRSLKDLPSDRVLKGYVKKAMKLNETGEKVARPLKHKPPAKAPADLIAALRKNAKAKATYDGFPPSQRREYIEWITEAKREETRRKRVAQAIVWMAEGKIRNWKYA